MDDPLKQNQGDQKFKCNQLNIEVILVAIYSSTFSKSKIFFQNVYYSGYSEYKRHCVVTLNFVWHEFRNSISQLKILEIYA